MDKQFRDYINGLSYSERLRWFAAAKFVRVGQISHVFENHIKVSYVVRIHGVIIANKNGELLYETEEEARTYGKHVLACWKDEYILSIDDISF